MRFSLGKVCKYLPLVTVILIVLNVLSIYLRADYNFFRFTPLFTVVVYLIYYILRASHIRYLIIAILIMLVLREISVFYFNKSSGQIAYILLGCVSYGLICIKRLDLFSTFIKDKAAILYTFIFIALNVFILNELISQVKESYQGSFQSGFVFLFGIIITFLGATAILYNRVANNNRSLAFLFFVFCFIFSDVSSLLAYYFGINHFYYLYHIFFVFGLTFFLYTVLDNSSQEEEQGELTNYS